MEKDKNVSFGVKLGIIIGLFYIAIIYLRYSQGAKNPIMFALIATIGFITALVLMFIAALQRRKAYGGYIELKDIFQTLFVTVLIFELFYTIFNFVYLKAIDPNFFQKFKEATENMMLKQGMSQEKVDEQMGKLDTDPAKAASASSIIINYLWSVAVSGVFALIISLIVRKKRPPFTNDQTIFQTTES